MDPELIDMLVYGAAQAVFVAVLVWAVIWTAKSLIEAAGRQYPGWRGADWWHTPLGRWVLRIAQPVLGVLIMLATDATETYPWPATPWTVDVAVGALAGLQAEVVYQWVGKLIERKAREVVRGDG